MTDGIGRSADLGVGKEDRPWPIKLLVAQMMALEVVYTVAGPGRGLSGGTLLSVALTSIFAAGLWLRLRIVFWTLLVFSILGLVGTSSSSDLAASWRVVFGLDLVVRATLLLLSPTRDWMRRPDEPDSRGGLRPLLRLTIALVAFAMLATTCGVIAAFMRGPSTSP